MDGGGEGVGQRGEESHMHANDSPPSCVITVDSNYDGLKGIKKEFMENLSFQEQRHIFLPFI